MNKICVILARKGSKGIPGKNIANLRDKPLISYTIEAAIQSQVFDKVIVSTDSLEIAEISRNLGAETPFIRSENLSSDNVLSKDALRDAVLKSEKVYGVQFDIIAELPCTSPLRSATHIQEAMQIMNRNYGQCDSVISLRPINHIHPLKIKRVIKNRIHDICDHFSEKQIGRRQEASSFFVRNGAIFIMTRDCIIQKGDRVGKISIPYIMDEKSSINIDSNFDMILAETILSDL